MENLQQAMEQMTTERDYKQEDLRALIKGANIVYTNAEIRNLTEFKTDGQEFDIRLSSSDQVVDIGDTRFCFRLKLPRPGVTINPLGLLDPWMYNLPDVATLFEVQSCTLDNTSLIYTNRVNKNMNIRRAIMSRVKQYDPECDPMQNKIQTAQQTIALSQELNIAGVVDKTATGGLIASQTCVSVLPGSHAGIDFTDGPSIGGSLKNLNSRCVDKLNELFCERGVFTNTQTGNDAGNAADNLSLTAILNDNKKRLAQASRQYQRCNNLFGEANALTAGLNDKTFSKGVERFYPMGNNVADGSIQDNETGNYYSVRLGDLVPELNSLNNFYMNGHTLTLRFKINQQSECLSQIAKPIAYNTYAQGSVAPTGAAQLKINSPYDNLEFVENLTSIIPTVCQPYLKMNLLHVDGSDKQAYKMIQDKLPISIKSYNHSQGTVTNSGQWFWQESFMTSSLSGVMICFTADAKPTGSNFDLTGVTDSADVTQAAVINATDFTKDGYDVNMARGPMWNHDHFYLPVYQVRVQIKNVVYKSNNPPLSQLTLQQWMAAQDSSKMVLGNGKFYDVSFQEYLANKCVFFIPTGKDYSGVDLRDGSLVQTTVVFSQDQSYKPPFKRTIANRFQGNVIYCCNGNIRFDRGYTEVV